MTSQKSVNKITRLKRDYNFLLQLAITYNIITCIDRED